MRRSESPKLQILEVHPVTTMPIAMSPVHPVRAVPGDDGGCCKLPVSYRPIADIRAA